MNTADPRVEAAVFDLVEAAIAHDPGRLAVIGICGAQGSGKSTLAHAVLAHCQSQGVAAATLSIDDLYLTRAEREKLAGDVHPLLATRGPPGTHDIALGMEVVAALERGEATPLPRFEKARDDRAPAKEWPVSPPGCRVLLLEGWCAGARPQAASELREPVNALEASEDAAGIWRNYVNDALAGAYQQLFARLDSLALLAAPNFEIVLEWRLQQERELRTNGSADSVGVMDDAGIARFIQHYERLTRHILREMPARADLLIRLDERRLPIEIHRRNKQVPG